MNEYSKALCHHGIRNQRWGVRNGPPYPLDQKTHKRIVKGKQGRQLKRENESQFGSLTGYAGWDRSNGSYSRRYDNPVKVQSMFRVKEYVGDEAVGTLQDKLQDSSYIESLRTLTGHGKITPDADLPACNPLLKKIDDYYNYGLPGKLYSEIYHRAASNNCLKCSSALALRAKGYDVTAGLAPDGMISNATERYWDGSRTYKENSTENAVRRMASFGNKGMGELKIRRASGNGHSMFFQNERQANGKYEPVVYDGQTGKRLGTVSEAVDMNAHDFKYFLDIVRLDDATPNFKKMAEDDVFVPTKGRFGSEGYKLPADYRKVLWE